MFSAVNYYFHLNDIIIFPDNQPPDIKTWNQGYGLGEYDSLYIEHMYDS